MPTGGDVPEGADAVVMLEVVEDYGDGDSRDYKTGGPQVKTSFFAATMCRRETLSRRPGRVLTPAYRGGSRRRGASPAFSVSAKTRRPVSSQRVDELVPCDMKPDKGQIRGRPTALLLASAVTEAGRQRPVIRHRL